MRARDSTIFVNLGTKRYQVWFPDPQGTCSECGAVLESYHKHEVSLDYDDMQQRFHEFEMAKGNVHKSNEDNFDNRTGKQRQRISAL